MATRNLQHADAAAPPAPAPEPAVRLTGVVKRFGDVTAVDGIDLIVNPGEVVAFLGPNGAGKTTSIDVMLGLSAPDRGGARLFGLDPGPAVASGRVAAVLQTGGLLRDLTVAETLRLIASLHRESRPVPEVLARSGLTALADRRVGSCSGGEQQRLRFAMALLPDPDLLVLDEPTTGLDVEARRAFWAAIRQDAAGGRTVIFATHYLDEADSYADRVVLIRQGRVVADGTSSQIKARASGRTVRATLPDADLPALAAFPGVTSVERRGDGVVVQTSDSDALLRHLLASTSARDLDVTSHSLEDAFVALTTDGSLR